MNNQRKIRTTIIIRHYCQHYCQVELTSKLDEEETPKNLEYFRQDDYLKGQVFEALIASLFQVV